MDRITNTWETNEPQSIYPTRPGFNLEQTIATIYADPEIVLTDDERQAALAFEKELTVSEELGSVPDRLTGEPHKVRGIEKIWETKTDDFVLSIDYLLTLEGQNHLARALNVPVEHLRFDDYESAKLFLFNFDFSQIPSKELDQLAGSGKVYIEKVMADQFEATGFTDISVMSTPVGITIYRNPAEVVQKIADYRALDDYHRLLRETLNQETSSALKEAKQVLLDIHQRRLNVILTDVYSDGYKLMIQFLHTGEEEPAKVLRANLPAISSLEDAYNRNKGRLDLFMHGVGVMDATTRNYSPIHAEALVYAERTANHTATHIDDFIFKDINPEAFREVKVTPQEWREWAEECLRHYGILSSSSDYDSSRAGRAADELWQVIIDPRATRRFGINGKQAVLKVPTGLNRSIGVASEDGASAVGVLDEEVGHILQVENRRRSGLSIADKVGLYNARVYNEAGAIGMQRQTSKELFGGRNEAASAHYLRAAQARLQGGSLQDCIKVFYDSYMLSNPNADKRSAIESAINRTRRFFGANESYKPSPFIANSTPLVYLEQRIVSDYLESIGRSGLLMLGINLEIFAQLHRIGLVDLNHLVLPDKRPSKVVIDKIRRKLQEYKGQKEA